MWEFQKKNSVFYPIFVYTLVKILFLFQLLDIILYKIQERECQKYFYSSLLCFCKYLSTYLDVVTGVGVEENEFEYFLHQSFSQCILQL